MTNRNEHLEREERAARLKVARQRADIGGYRKLATKFGWNENTYKAHENGRNGFGLADAKRYAKAFKVSLNWLNFGLGNPDDIDEQVIPHVASIPLVARISAGALQRDDLTDEQLGTINFGPLPEGDWFAMEVEGDSMDRLSPPQSLIIANRADKKLVSNGCYIIADEHGNATYKRYRPNPDRFEPVSTNPVHEAIYPDHIPPVVARVHYTLLKL